MAVSDIGVEYRRLEFDPYTRAELEEEFKRQFNVGRTLSPSDIDFEAKVFIGTLQNYADGIPAFQRMKPPEQKRRREKVRALANTLEKLHEALTCMDSAALGFALWCGLREVESTGLGSNPLPPGMPAVIEASVLRGDALPFLAAFSCGVQKAIKELPSHEFNFLLKTALAVERTFFDYQLPFTVSNSGFAATCLRAVFKLGGLEIDRVDYWLTEARDSEDSMIALIKRHVAAQKSADE